MLHSDLLFVLLYKTVLLAPSLRTVLPLLGSIPLRRGALSPLYRAGNGLPTWGLNLLSIFLWVIGSHLILRNLSRGGGLRSLLACAVKSFEGT